MAAINDTRQVQMTVDLGGEQVKIERARFVDKLGQPFELQVDVVAMLGEIDLLPHLGKPIAIHLHEDDEVMRHFHGLIVGGEFKQESGSGFHYRLQARPFTYFLAHNRDMAIFQDLPVPEIIKKVLSNGHISDFKLELRKTYHPRTYCVQYRESDFAFITRLMEEEGIYYYWTHSESKHVMVLCDSPSAHTAGTPGTLTFNTSAGSMHRAGSGERGGSKHFLESWGERVASGGEAQVTLRAFDFEKPERPLSTHAYDPLEHPNDNREVYQYPNRFFNHQLDSDQALVPLTTLRRDRLLYAGRTQATSLACGSKLTVQDHFAKRLDQTYLITRVEHVLQGEQYRAQDSSAENEDEEATRVVIEAIPADTPFHLPQVTPKPLVQGLETAIVSGPDGEEIYTDEHGRVKVRFHWDRSDTTGEKSTCWIRVAQFGGLGNIILPRIGQEVMVDFLHGNPDEPIVVGWVFNQTHRPIYPLPENKTRALWRTKSYMGGKSTKYPEAETLDTDSPGANELRFEDKSGKEEVFLHAEKDMNLRTRNDQTNHVAHNQYDKVFWDRDAYVGRDETTTIKRHQTLTIKEGNQTETIEMGNREVTIKMGNDTETVSMGNISVKASMGKIEMEALQSITLKVGGSSVVIDQVGVTIKGTVNVDLKGIMVTSSADAMSTLKGGIVMIN
ncbi:type VI secretion system Vgr family protein [Sphingomonas sp.]|uniref:type VI secretion system Vgr family protein n=1 Tax=Sphingomonas sp. TaxID=28214 RepID=UPI003AFFAE55